MAWYLKFEYDAQGRGELVMDYGDYRHSHPKEYLARTGSINANGELVNALPSGQWFITCRPVETDEPPMVLDEGQGWKVRLYKPAGMGEYERTHYLIHPDGSADKKHPRNGTTGCIGLAETYISLKHLIHEILQHQENICLSVTQKGVTS